MGVVNIDVKGGEQMTRILTDMERNLGSSAMLRVGFLEGAKYPAKVNKPALNVATVAFWNEFGTRTAPARPFFRNMVKAKSPGWGRSMARIAQQNNYNAEKTLRLMGIGIQAQLRQSINQWPADNAPRTVAKKGFNKGLIDTAQMLRSVDFHVLLGSAKP